jgi:hypothetical protein
VDGISQAVMPGNPFTLVATGDGVVTQHITVVVAGWTLTSLREHWDPKPVLHRDKDSVSEIFPLSNCIEVKEQRLKRKTLLFYQERWATFKFVDYSLYFCHNPT